MKYWVLKTGGVEPYAEAMAGGNLPATWPRQIQLPIEATPLTGWVGSLVAVPAGSVPAGKIFPLMMNGSPRLPAKNPGEPVRQSQATSKVRMSSDAASAKASRSCRGLNPGPTPARPARMTRPKANNLTLPIRFMCNSFHMGMRNWRVRSIRRVKLAKKQTMKASSRSAVTELLQAWSNGDRTVEDRLWPIVFDELLRKPRRS